MWMDLERIVLDEISQTKANIVYHLYVESKKAKLIETESRMVITREWGGPRVWGDAGQRVQSCN